MATINDLPIEILSHIFWLAVLDARKPCGRFLKRGYVDPWFSSDYKTSAPFVFLKVCGHWRAVAKSTPLLWSTLNASNYRFYKGDCYPLPLEALAYWLSLSDSAPLNLYLTTPLDESGGPELPLGYVEQIFQLLAKDSRRWQSLSIFFDAHTCQTLEDVFNQLAPDALPNLRCLDLDTTAAREVFDLTTLAQVIGSIGSLRELHLSGNSLNPCLRGIQWGRLTTIVIYAPLTVDEAAFYLAQSKTAETVTFNALSYWTDPDASYPPHTTLPCLKSLTLNGTPESHKLLDVFDFPSLESLTIESHDPFPHASSLTELIERSHCPLKNLLISLGSLSASDAAEHLLNPCLYKVPQVVLECDVIRGEFKEIAQASRKHVPPIWMWKAYAGGAHNIGWRRGFDEHFQRTLINLTT